MTLEKMITRYKELCAYADENLSPMEKIEKNQLFTALSITYNDLQNEQLSFSGFDNDDGQKLLIQQMLEEVLSPGNSR